MATKLAHNTGSGSTMDHCETYTKALPDKACGAAFQPASANLEVVFVNRLILVGLLLGVYSRHLLKL